MDKYYPNGDKTDNAAVYGPSIAATTVQVLKQCGDELTRENVMRQAANLQHFRLPILALGQLVALPAAADDAAARRQTLEPYFRNYRPSGAGPFPAILMVSGCSGFTPSIAPQVYTRAAERWRSKGYVVVFVDYLSARGLPNCRGSVAVNAVEIGRDVLAVARYLQGQPYVKASQISAVGWSLGGGAVLAALGRHPEGSVIAASHTEELAERFGRRVRNLVASEAHRNVFGVGVAADRKSVGEWETEAGGEYYAAGVGGSITGRRADLGVIDDPVRGREDADSERARETAWQWYVNDFLPRLKPGASQIVIMTRWHEDDLGGRLLDREASKWRVVELPMEALPGDPLRNPGERLWPEWFTAEMVETAKRDPRAWNALYQQRPVVEEGDYFKLEWFAPFVHLPENVTRYGASDYAVTYGGGDYTEHGVFALDPLGTLYLIDWWRGQTVTDIWIERQCDLILKHQPLCWFGEKGVIEKAVRPYLTHRMNERRAYCRIEWLPSVTEKTARARSFQALASMNKVMVPVEAPWKAELLGQLTRFPAGKYDDGVDVCSLIGRGLKMMPTPAPIGPGRNRRPGRYHRSDYDPYAYTPEEMPGAPRDGFPRARGW